MALYDIIVIGGGPAGLTAALYALRFNKKVLVIEKEAFGGQMNNSPKIENYPGFEMLSGMELSDKMTEQVLDKGCDVELARVESVSSGDIKRVKTEYGEFEAKAVIIATGVRHRHLGLQREEELTGHGVYYCAICDGKFYENKEVVLIGGGNSALQEAVMLSDICSKLTIVQNLAFFTGEEQLVKSIEAKKNVFPVFSSVASHFLGEEKFEGIATKNTETGKITEIKADAVFVAIGLEPDNGDFADIAKLDAGGYFDADESLATLSPGIFVAGDCRAKKYRQIVTATSDGASAALAACRYIDTLTK